MSDVTIPREVALRIAAWLRANADESGLNEELLPRGEWADLLDPRPSLRDAVARAICDSDHGDFIGGEADDYRKNADAALAVVRDHIAALPLPDAPTVYCHGYNDALIDVLRPFDGADS